MGGSDPPKYGRWGQGWQVGRQGLGPAVDVDVVGFDALTALAASFDVTAPPSPRQVMFLLLWKL